LGGEVELDDEGEEDGHRYYEEELSFGKWVGHEAGDGGLKHGEARTD